jgi:hypothetical protein
MRKTKLVIPSVKEEALHIQISKSRSAIRNFLAVDFRESDIKKLLVDLEQGKMLDSSIDKLCRTALPGKINELTRSRLAATMKDYQQMHLQSLKKAFR